MMSVIRKIVLGDGTELNIQDNISYIDALYKGIYTKAVSFIVVGKEFNDVENIFSNKEALNVIKEMNDDGSVVINTYDGFTDLYNVGVDYSGETAACTVSLARPVDYQKDMNDLKSALSEVKYTVYSIAATPDPSTMELDHAIEYLATCSKKELNDYLEKNPITSTAHGGVEAKYSITREKQNLLTSMILMTQMAAQNGLEYTPSWNATNEPCTYDWTIEELQTLAVEIESTVRPLISLQQTIESHIRKATTVEDAIAAAVNFEDAVKEYINSKEETTTEGEVVTETTGE